MENIKYIDFNIDKITESEQAFLKDFFKMRHESYQKIWGGDSFFDDDMINTDDTQKGTHFLLALHNNKVIGGGRIVIHEPTGKQILPLEKTFRDERFSLKYILPHYADSLDDMRYAETGSFTVHPDYMSKNVGRTIMQKGYDLIHKINEANKPLDFIAFTANQISIGLAIKEADKNGFKTIVRKDLRFKHPKVKNDTVFAIQSNQPNFKFLSEAQIKTRCGIDGLDYLNEEKTRQR